MAKRGRPRLSGEDETIRVTTCLPKEEYNGIKRDWSYLENEDNNF